MHCIIMAIQHCCCPFPRLNSRHRHRIPDQLHALVTLIRAISACRCTAVHRSFGPGPGPDPGPSPGPGPGPGPSFLPFLCMLLLMPLLTPKERPGR